MSPIDIVEKFSEPFSFETLQWRVGNEFKLQPLGQWRGQAMPYIDARDVMDRLDDVVGPANWQCAYPHAAQKTVCTIGLRINDEWIYKADGAGDTDNMEAVKGALSDSFKRAAVRWGIGRYLYALPKIWVDVAPCVENQRKYEIVAKDMPRIKRFMNGEIAHEWFAPDVSDRVNKFIKCMDEYKHADDLNNYLHSADFQHQYGCMPISQRVVFSKAVKARQEQLESTSQIEETETCSASS